MPLFVEWLYERGMDDGWPENLPDLIMLTERPGGSRAELVKPERL